MVIVRCLLKKSNNKKIISKNKNYKIQKLKVDCKIRNTKIKVGYKIQSKSTPISLIDIHWVFIKKKKKRKKKRP